MADIFVSYARDDRDRVEKLVRLFEARGWTVFWDPTLLPGHQWDKRLGAELAAARCVVVAWSAASVGSKWVREEASLGRDKDILVPVSLDGTQAPFGFALIQSENLAKWQGGRTDPGAVRLLEGITRVLTDPTGSAANPPSVSRPPAPRRADRNRTTWALVAALGVAGVVVAATLGPGLWPRAPLPDPAHSGASTTVVEKKAHGDAASPERPPSSAAASEAGGVLVAEAIARAADRATVRRWLGRRH